MANKIRNELYRWDYDVYLYSVEDFQPIDTQNFDVLILGYPIYACDMPVFLQAYVNQLTLPVTKNVIVFSTMGIYGAKASLKVGKRLINKGMRPLHFEEIKMPGSDGLVKFRWKGPSA